MKQVELKEEEKIFFIPSTENYGSAEFMVCPVFKYGKLRDLFIYPRQQPDKGGTYWHIKCWGQKAFQVRSWTHKGFENPNIWCNFWCNEHKCLSFDIYPPKKANYFSVSMFVGTLELLFDYEER